MFNKGEVGKHARVEDLCQEESEEETFLTSLERWVKHFIHDPVYQRPLSSWTSAVSSATATACSISDMPMVTQGSNVMMHIAFDWCSGFLLY